MPFLPYRCLLPHSALLRSTMLFVRDALLPTVIATVTPQALQLRLIPVEDTGKITPPPTTTTSKSQTTATHTTSPSHSHKTKVWRSLFTSTAKLHLLPSPHGPLRTTSAIQVRHPLLFPTTTKLQRHLPHMIRLHQLRASASYTSITSWSNIAALPALGATISGTFELLSFTFACVDSVNHQDYRPEGCTIQLISVPPSLGQSIQVQGWWAYDPGDWQDEGPGMK